MAPNDDAQYKMNPARLQNLHDEAVAQSDREVNTFNIHDFLEPQPSANRRTAARGKKPPTKCEVYFTYGKGKRKNKKTPSGEVQYHVVAKKGKRKDKRKAMEAIQKLADEHEAAEREMGQQMRTRMHGDTTNTEEVESKDGLNLVREESDAKDEDMYKAEN